MRRWKINTKMMIGTVTRLAAAAMLPVGSVNCESPVKNAIAAGNRPRRVRRRQRDREDEVVPAEDEDEDRGGEHAGRRKRDDHLAEGLERGRAVDLRRLLEVPRDLAEERDERVDRQRQGEREVGDDQAEPGVVEPQRAPHVEERADRRDRAGTWRSRARRPARAPCPGSRAARSRTRRTPPARSRSSSRSARCRSS